MCSLEKRGDIYILTITGADEHRLNPNLIATIRSALSEIRSSSSPGSALVTTADGKFFSNGFDIPWARATSSSPEAAHQKLFHMVSLFRPLVADFLSLPLPTVAAVTGHAAAAGFMLAVSHDYVAMRGDRGVLYMSELDIGLVIPSYFIEMMRTKFRDARVLRDVALRARKFAAREAAENGIVDFVGRTAEDTLEIAVRLAEELAGRKWDGKVYASIRMAAFPNLCRSVGLEEGDEVNKGVVSKL